VVSECALFIDNPFVDLSQLFAQVSTLYWAKLKLLVATADYIWVVFASDSEKS
jgi:hypothetical protein